MRLVSFYSGNNHIPVQNFNIGNFFASELKHP
jgi:hypothetical protein